MKAIMRALFSAPYPIGSIARSGRPCPETGSWRVVDQERAETSISAGLIMPHYMGEKVDWYLARYGS
jgi:hypothetical protein